MRFLQSLFSLSASCACALIATAASAPSQKIQLLKNINATTGKEPRSNIKFLGTWKGKTFFVGTDSKNGEAPYVTDGTQAGTKQILEILRGNYSIDARKGFAVAKGFIFQTKWKSSSFAVISTDGTEKGTFKVLRSPSHRDKIKVLNQIAYVAGSGSSDSLFRTDGSLAGTKLVVQIGSGITIDKLWVANGKLWLDVLTTNSRELWVSDGTAKGTKHVYQLSVPYKGERIYAIFGLNGKTYMHATIGTRSGIWVTDGTSAGTKFVTAMAVNTFTEDNWISTGKLFLAEVRDTKNGAELWVSDGTKSGTRLLKDINPGSASSSPHFFRMLGKKVIFRAKTAKNGPELWITDGTSAGTQLIKDINGTSSASGYYATVLGNRAWFFADDGKVGSELWITDGTAAGTRLVKDIEPGAKGSFGWDLMPGLTGMYFSTLTTAYNTEPWFSDGTAKGTRLVRNVFPPPALGSSVLPLGSGSSFGFFSADDGKSGKELWISDGTSAGTRLLKDLLSGTGSSEPKKMTRVGNKWFFLARTPTSWDELWVTDGTSQGTKFLKDINPGVFSSRINWMTSFRGKLFFSADDKAHGEELWVSDGTSAGTLLLKDIFPKQTGSRPSGFFLLRDRLFFEANDLLQGRVVFVTDGTAAGTTVAGLAGKKFLSVYPLGPIGDRYLLSAANATSGRELWITDGTLTGTVLLKDIEPGKGSSQPSPVTRVGDKYYFSATTSTHGAELWVTDGTPAGTQLAFDFLPGRSSSRPFTIRAFGDRFLFTASKKYLQRSLFISDGTLKGTVELKAWEKGLYVALSEASPGMQIRYFGLSTQATGGELWRTDGTPQGTRMVQELRPGSLAGADGRSIRVINGRYVFVGIDAGHGQELFTLEGLALSSAMGHPCGKDLPTLRASDPVLGGRVVFEGRSSPVGQVGLLCLGAAPKTPLNLGRGCELWFDLLGFYPLSAFAVTGRNWSFQVPVPASPGLRGKVFASQMIYFPIQAGANLQVSQGVMSQMY